MAKRIIKRVAVVAVVLVPLVLAVVWWTRDSWATGMLVLTPSPGFETGPLPEGVREAVEVTRDGARIRAWVLDPAAGRAARGTVLMLHGIRSDKRRLLSGARQHAADGLRVVPVDSRGHGESSGRYHTYGVAESRDLVALVDELERRQLLVKPLAVLGSSYGAATALQYAARDPRVDKVVAMAPFASLREVVPAYLQWILGKPAALIPRGVVDELIDTAARHAGFDADDACPRCVAAQVHVPVLLIHSQDDERIPWQHSRVLRDALGARARLLLVHGVSHVQVGSAPGVDEAVARFLDER